MKRGKLLQCVISCLILVYCLSLFTASVAFSAPPLPPPIPGIPIPKPPRRVAPPPPRHVPPPRVYAPPRVHVPPPPPHRVVRRSLPADVFRLHVAGALFFYHMGHYYQHASGGYATVAAPIGARVNVLPSGCSTLRVGGRLFFNCAEVYYEPIDNGFIVANPPAAVQSTHAMASPGDRVRVNTNILNVRSGPGVHFKQIGQLYRGQIVVVDSVDQEWYYITTPNGKHGWIMSDYTNLIPRQNNSSSDGSKG